MRGVPRGGPAHPPEYDRFETEAAGEHTPALRRSRPKPKGLGPVTWLALLTFAIIAVSLLDSHRRSSSRAAALGPTGAPGSAHAAKAPTRSAKGKAIATRAGAPGAAGSVLITTDVGPEAALKPPPGAAASGAVALSSALSTPAAAGLAAPASAGVVDMSAGSAMVIPLAPPAAAAAAAAAASATAAATASPMSAGVSAPAAAAAAAATTAASTAATTGASSAPTAKQFVAAGVALSQATSGVLPAGFPPAPSGVPLLQWADTYWFETLGAPAPSNMPPAPDNLSRKQWAAQYVYGKQQAAAQTTARAAFVANGGTAGSDAAAPAPGTEPDADTLTWHDVSTYDELATCNDGTAAGFYYAPGSDPTIWLIYLQGGLWCYDQESCMERAAKGPQQISSSTWPSTITQDGIFDTNATTNPFAAANKVFVPYCTSDAWLGDVASAQTEASYGFDWSFRGQRVIRATFAALESQFGLGAAAGEPPHRVLFGGCSAGARGAMYAVDTLSATTGPSYTISAMLDSPLWLNVAPFDPAVPSLLDQCQLAYGLFNASGSVNPACLLTFSTTPYYCLMGQYLMPFLTSPYFLNEAQFDAFQLPYNIGGWPQLTVPAQMSYADSFQASMVAALDTLPAPSQANVSAVFSLSCLRHCLSLGPAFWSAQVGAVSMADALAEWFFDGEEGGRTMGTCQTYQRCVMC